jgi:hypothetical protein
MIVPAARSDLKMIALGFVVMLSVHDSTTKPPDHKTTTLTKQERFKVSYLDKFEEPNLTSGMQDR